MKLVITPHAKSRIKKYQLNSEVVKDTLKNPETILQGYRNRKIAQKSLNSHLLRVIFEKKKNINVVVTVYKARRDRYEV